MTNKKDSKTLYQSLWNSADILRSKMDANEYKSYLLGLVFYKYLSDKMLYYVTVVLDKETEDLNEAQRIYEHGFVEDHDELRAELIDEFSYLINPKLTFTALVEDIYNNRFQLTDLAQGFRDVEQSSEVFENLFEDVDLNSKKLGSTIQKQNQSISEVMKELATINLSKHDGDILGDAYEYLIGQFASDSGKKAGEFYTPQSVARLMTQIVLINNENKQGFTVYDPTMGSGSLLLNAKKYSNEPGTIGYFGQELNTSTYNLARMNMILHSVPVSNQHLHNADTLDQDWPTDEPTNFDAVLMNPPYSAKWAANKGFLDDPRFAPYGVLAPKSYADFAFLLHGFYHLNSTGTMAIVLPHGVLFRGNAEGKIREGLLNRGSIYAVIGLPANIFFNTSIPTVVVVLKKNNTSKDVLFIDSSKNFEKSKNQNLLLDEHIEAILNAYKERKDIDKYAHLAKFEEIVENDFNLNIPRYVDTFEEEEPIDLKKLNTEIETINKEIEETEIELLKMLDDLVVNEDSKELIELTKRMLNHGK